MPDGPNVIDGQPVASRDELIAAIDTKRARWQAAVARAVGLENEVGPGREWTLRDVVAHINAYLRFHVGNLGGPARALGEMPEGVGFDTEKRNQWMHEQDLGLPWPFVRDEGEELHRELIAQLAQRSDEDFDARLVPWHDWPTWRWMCDIRNHYDQHQPRLEAWLTANAGRS